MQAKNSTIERIEMTEQLLVELEGSPDNSQPAIETPSDKTHSTNSPDIVQTIPSSRQLSTGDGAPAKKSKVTLTLVLHFILNTLCFSGINSEEERAWRSGSSQIHRAADS